MIAQMLASWSDRWTAVAWLLVWLVVCRLFIWWAEGVPGDRVPADDDKVSDDEA